MLMKCEICNKEKQNLHKFYWGFFNTEYDPDKWIMACKDCQTNFLKASNVYCMNKNPLIEMEQQIKKKIKKR